MKRGTLLVFLGMIVVLILPAQRFWEGSVAAGRYGDFPPEGYYGTTMLFPRNSIVEVQNLDTGKAVRVIITGELKHPSLLMLVSEKAAEDLGLAGRDPAPVRVSLLVSAIAPLPDPGFDLPYSPDPDVNPAAAAGDVNLLVDKRRYRSDPSPEAPPARPEILEMDEVVDPGEESELDGYRPIKPLIPLDEPEISMAAVVGKETPERMVKPQPPADTPELSPEARRVAVERLDSIVDSIPYTLPNGQLGLEELDSGGIEDTIDIVDIDQEGELEELEEPSLIAQEASPLEVETTESIPVETESVIPGSLSGETWAQSNLPLLAGLDPQAYYLQVATYSDPRRAHSLVDLLGENYPVAVESVAGEKPLYRVLVGPVSDDERGVALRNLRAEGFRDAFSRQSN